jgi:hypothetical protein
MRAGFFQTKRNVSAVFGLLVRIAAVDGSTGTLRHAGTVHAPDTLGSHIAGSRYRDKLEHLHLPEILPCLADNRFK